MALSLSIGCRDGLANTQGLSELFEGGTLRIMSGVAPGVEYGVTGYTLLEVDPINFSSAGTGKIYVSEAATVGQAGTAAYFRISSSDDNPQINADGTAVRMEGTCGVLEDSCDLLLPGLEMTAGNYVTVFGNLKIS